MKAKEALGIQPDKIVILYAPTFREYDRDNGNKKAVWELRKRAVAAAGDVIRSNAPFALKLKLIGVTIMPHIYFAMLKGRKN